MGTMVRRRLDVAEQSVPHLHALRDLTGETVHLAVLHTSEILYLRNKQLNRVLTDVRDNGYAIDDEESENGMRGIAAPIFDAAGAVAAAVGVVGPAQRLTKLKLQQLASSVVKTAY